MQKAGQKIPDQLAQAAGLGVGLGVRRPKDGHLLLELTQHPRLLQG